MGEVAKARVRLEKKNNCYEGGKGYGKAGEREWSESDGKGSREVKEKPGTVMKEQAGKMLKTLGLSDISKPSSIIAVQTMGGILRMFAPESKVETE